jgi:hypothetical protein
MGDQAIAAIEQFLLDAWTAIRGRSDPLPAYTAFPDGDEGGPPPPGYRNAFLAGAVPPWPGAKASVMGDYAGTWRELRRTKPSGSAKPRPDTGHAFRVRGSNSGAAGLGASRWETSGNWSGAVITARDGERFSAACARWRVPGARPSDNAPPAIPGPDANDPLSRRVSVWVGLDGHRACAGSLPQIGTTTAECFKDGKRWVETYAWAQWWVRGQQFGEVVFEDFEVHPGDRVTCWLALHQPDRLVLCIRNHRTGNEDSRLWRSGTKAEDLLAVRAHPGAPPAPVSGMAAVWVVERPTVMGRTDLYPLPDFDKVEFEDCIAGVGASGEVFDEVPDLRDLRGARLLRMTDGRTEPWRCVQVAGPDQPGDVRSSLTVRYRG